VPEQLERSGAGGRKLADPVVLSGVLAWADLGLRLTERFLGPSVMLETARHMNVDPPRHEQRLYSDFEPRTKHGDSAMVDPTQACQPNAEVIIGMIDLVAALTVVLVKN
jgi:transcriptional regulator GlxA family with amidase domain